MEDFLARRQGRRECGATAERYLFVDEAAVREAAGLADPAQDTVPCDARTGQAAFRAERC